MKLAGTYQLPGTPETVYDQITDPVVLQECIQGCEKMVKTSEDSYDVHLKLGLAGLKGSYTGKITLQNKQPPQSYTLVMEGKGGPGFVKGTANITLTSAGDKTELQCDADAQVGGLIASIGSRLVTAAGKKLMDAFFKKFTEKVVGGR